MNLTRDVTVKGKHYRLIYRGASVVCVQTLKAHGWEDVDRREFHAVLEAIESPNYKFGTWAQGQVRR
jgi:hypothetical protein